jgi:hypothetical protein
MCFIDRATTRWKKRVQDGKPTTESNQQRTKTQNTMLARPTSRLSPNSTGREKDAKQADSKQNATSIETKHPQPLQEKAAQC